MAQAPFSDNIDQSLQKLAEQVVYNAEFRRMRKSAELPEALRHMAGAAVDTVKKTPTIQGALLGAGLGGLYGAGSSLMRPEEERRTGRSAVSGALAGGAAGAGLGLAGSQLHSFLKNRTPAPTPAGDFTNKGKAYNLKDPAAASELLPKVQQLEERSPLTRAVGAVKDTVGGYVKDNPILSMIGAGDLASHAVGTAAEMTDVGRGTAATRTQLQKAMETLKDNPVFADAVPAVSKMTRQRSGDFYDSWNHHLRARDPIIELIKQKNGPKPFAISSDTLADMGHAATGPIRPGGVRSLLDIYHTLTGHADKVRESGNVSDLQAGLGRTSGARNWIRDALKLQPGGTAAKAVDGAGDLYANAVSKINSMDTPGGKILPRIGLYAGVPALQALWARHRGESQAQRQLQDLIKQTATPVGG